MIILSIVATEELYKKTIEWLTDLSLLMNVLFFVFILTCVFSKKFRNIVFQKISDITSIGKDGIQFERSSQSASTDQSKPEINPKQLANGSTTSVADLEATEQTLLDKMFSNTFVDQDLEELNRTYTKLKGLSNRAMDDEEVQSWWFFLRIALNDNVVKELSSIAESHQGWYFPYKLLAKYYLKLEELNRVEHFLEEASKRACEDSEKCELHYLKAELIGKQHGKEKALEYLKIVESNAEWSESKNDLFQKMAEYYGELGNRINQQIMLEKAVHEAPENEVLRFELAYKYAEEQSTYLLALYQYKLLLKINHKHNSALNNIAILYEKLGLKGESHKYINLAIDYGSAHAKGNRIIDLCEQGFLVEAEKLQNSLTEDEKKDDRILDALRHLNEANKSESEKLNKLNPIIASYGKLSKTSLETSTDKSKFIGTWKSDNEELKIEIDTNNKIAGSYSTTTENYLVSGDFNQTFIILCLENRSSLSILEKLSLPLSMRLFAIDDHLDGFVWDVGYIPEKVRFSR